MAYMIFDMESVADLREEKNRLPILSFKNGCKTMPIAGDYIIF